MSNLKAVEFQIPRSSDSKLVSSIIELANWGDGGCSLVQFALVVGGSPIRINRDELGSDATLAKIKHEDSHAFESIDLYFKDGAQVSIRPRKVEQKIDPFICNIHVNVGQVQDRDWYMSLVSQAKSCLHEIDLDVSISKIASADEQRYIQSRDLYLQQQERSLNHTIHKLDEYVVTLTERFDLRKQEQDRQAAQKIKEIEESAAAKEVAFAEREAALAQKIEEVNAQESKFERRKTIKDLIDQLDNTNAKFKIALTESTQRMRRPVFGFTLLLLAILLGAAAFTTYQDVSNPSVGWQWIRSSMLSLTFIVAFVFFVKWLNNWFEQHAKEEFRLKRMLLEVRRANLLIETALEWEKDGNGQMPQELLAALSRDLFYDGSHKYETVAPVESLATALLGSAQQLKLKLGEGEISLDRKGLDALKKPAKE
jgi:hypothetical protein